MIKLITGASKQLIAPLIESLRHDMVVQENRLQQELAIEGLSFEQSLKTALSALNPNFRRDQRTAGSASEKGNGVLIQRLTLPLHYPPWNWPTFTQPICASLWGPGSRFTWMKRNACGSACWE